MLKKTFLAPIIAILLVYSPETPAQDLSDEQINQTVKRVIDHNDFRSVRRRMGDQEAKKGWLESILDSIVDWLNQPDEAANAGPSSLGEGRPMGGLSQMIMLVVITSLIVIVVLILIVIIRSVDSSKSDQSAAVLGSLGEDALKPSAPPGELAATIYEQRALQFAKDGNYQAAIRELLLGSMSWIERSGLIRFRRGLTNRDYWRSLWRDLEKRSAYETTASEFEQVYFGRRLATLERFHSCLNSFQGAFREEIAAGAKS